VALKNAAAADGLFFAPFDWPGPVRRALERLKPRLLVLVETELWPNLIHEASRYGTRIAIVNGRISPRSFPRYRRIRALLGRVLAEIDLFLMQGEAHAARVKEMGAPPERVRVAGNLKFDALPDPIVPVEVRAVLETHRPLWIAGSTVSGEEEAVLEAFRQVRRTEPEASLMLVPRHPERFETVVALIEAAGFRCLRRSTLAPGRWSGEEVVVLDTLGELARVYPLASVVFVGGSLVPAGGHNILEAAVAGKAVIVGPHMENFQEIANQFDEAGALVRVSDAATLGAAVSSLLKDAARREELGRRAHALIGVHQGALARTADALVELLR
jgi:3-deoxy-D-manno-octulosonic-acid transferase